MYERFTDRARQVMQLAHNCSMERNIEYVSPDHILAGLMRCDGAAMGRKVLENLGVDLRQMRIELEKLLDSGPQMAEVVGKLPMTPRAKKVIERAMEDARNLNHNYVGTEHLLLGLMGELEGHAANVISKFGLTVERVRGEVAGLFVVAKHGSDEVAVLTRVCFVGYAVETKVFSDAEAAMAHCEAVFGVKKDQWEAYLTCDDPNSSLMLNGKPVRYCGWQHELGEDELLHIQICSKTNNFEQNTQSKRRDSNPQPTG